ncbi:hypothetical protein [Weissella muntiaci]|nr:hypothetical protein [Weissella muntiaci]
MTTNTKIIKAFRDNVEWRNLLLAGNFGLEMEVNRIQRNGELSAQPYPRLFGDRRKHPFLKSDYSEGMIELVTPVGKSIKEAYDELRYLTYVLRHELYDNEGLWPLSLPPRVKENDVEWLDTFFEKNWEQRYHNYLIQRYGSVHGIISGPHINLAVNQQLIERLFELSGEQDLKQFTNNFYYRIGQGFEANRGLLIYLFGASPINFNDSDQNIPKDLKLGRSIRNSQYGYVNTNEVAIDYAGDFNEHVDKIRTAVTQGKIFAPSEFYGTVRFKGHGSYEDLRDNGIEYLELRIIDTNPFDENGIALADLNIIQFLVAWMIVFNKSYTDNELVERRKIANQVALSDPFELFDFEEQFIDELKQVNQIFGGYFTKPMLLILERLKDAKKTPAGQLMQITKTKIGLHDWARQVALNRQQAFRNRRQDALTYEKMARLLTGE